MQKTCTRTLLIKTIMTLQINWIVITCAEERRDVTAAREDSGALEYRV